jgi:hypothetical protein
MPNPYVSSVVTVFPFVLSVKNCWFGCVQPVNSSARFSPAFSLDHGRFCAWDDTSDRKSVQNGSNRPHLRLVLHYRRRSDIAYCAFWTGSGPSLTRVSLSLCPVRRVFGAISAQLGCFHSRVNPDRHRFSAKGHA